jgi:hypothetical protein
MKSYFEDSRSGSSVTHVPGLKCHPCDRTLSDGPPPPNLRFGGGLQSERQRDSRAASHPSPCRSRRSSCLGRRVSSRSLRTDLAARPSDEPRDRNAEADGDGPLHHRCAMVPLPQRSWGRIAEALRVAGALLDPPPSLRDGSPPPAELGEDCRGAPRCRHPTRSSTTRSVGEVSSRERRRTGRFPSVSVDSSRLAFRRARHPPPSLRDGPPPPAELGEDCRRRSALQAPYSILHHAKRGGGVVARATTEGAVPICLRRLVASCLQASPTPSPSGAGGGSPRRSALQASLRGRRPTNRAPAPGRFRRPRRRRRGRPRTRRTNPTIRE